MRAYGLRWTRGIVVLILAATWTAKAAETVAPRPAPLLQAAPATMKPIEEILPANTIALLSFPNLGATRQRFGETAISQLLNDPAVQEWLKPIKPEMEKALAALDEKLAEAKLTRDEIVKLLDGPAAIAFTGLQLTPKPDGQGVFLLAPGDTENLKGVIAKLNAKSIADGDAIVTNNIMGFEVYSDSKAEVPLSFSVVNNVFALAYGKSTMEETIAALTGNQPNRLKDSPIFKPVAAKLRDSSQEMFFYLNADQCFALAQLAAPAETMMALYDIGLTEIQALGTGFSFNGPAIAEAAFIYMPKADGRLANLLKPEPINQKLLEMVPAEAVEVFAARVNAAMLWDFVMESINMAAPEELPKMQKGIANIEQAIGFNIRNDLLGSLGNECVVYKLAADQPAPNIQGELTPTLMASMVFGQIGRQVIILPIKDSSKFNETLVKLNTLAHLAVTGKNQAKPEPTISITEENVGNVKMNVFRSEAIKGWNFAWGMTDAAFVIGFPAEEVAKALQNPTRKDNFLNSRAYLETKSRIADNAGIIAITDWSRSGGTLASLQAMILPLTDTENMPESVRQLIKQDIKPVSSAIGRHLFPGVYTWQAEPDGLLYQRHSPVGSMPMSIGGVAVASGLLLPALVNAREEARLAKDMSNLKQIGLAITVYGATNNNAMPESLMALVPDCMDNPVCFNSPLDDSPAPADGSPRVSYRYIGALPEEARKLNLNLIVAYTKVATHKGYRNVLFLDGHVERVVSGEFRAKLENTQLSLNQFDLETKIKERIKAFCEDRDYTPAVDDKEAKPAATAPPRPR